MSSKERLKRSEVQESLTWDLTHLFPSDEDWSQGLSALKTNMEEIASYQGRLSKGSALNECLLKIEDLSISITKLGTYASLRQSEDGTNPSNQERSMIFGGVATQFGATLSFVQSEITALSKEEYDNLYKECTELEQFRLHLDDIYAKKSHMLSQETEKVLASMGELMNSPYRIYGVSKAADMVFENFEDHEGNSLPNSFALFETNYEFSKHRVLRANAYKSFNKTLERYKNTYAGVYAAEVKKQVALSKLRGYSSVTEMLLEPHKVTLEMYNNQIDTIYTKLAPHMQRLARLKAKDMGIEKISFYDLKAPMDPDFEPPATIESIKDVLIESLSILGDEYTEAMNRAFDERWIDFADNVGKSTGAFCASPYGVHSYILITYQDNMRSAFTLAHELGHAGHFTLANRYQRIFNTRPSTYFVEAPSTINEMFLAEHLMKNTKDDRMKRWVILQLLGTYYHNFVTHLLEAEFQRRVYALAEKNIPLTAKSLCDTKHDVISTFWGDSVEVDKDAGMTWMRQPHYYMGLYPYTYSAGLSAATAISRQIFEEGSSAVERWLEVLKAGGTLPPRELLLKAGIDMSTPEPIEVAVEYVGSLIEELEGLF